ncbi:MAG: YfcE family phosphodiesterase [Candidatus Electrothrix sp. ATG2]|nr:YfcE family phosphodiesterase [Candidatus Electrothrix sp. ATG2]
MIKAGILSDTHLTKVNEKFLQRVEQCFSDCDVIIHAGDFVDISLLDVFSGKTVHAVHGNCCNGTTRTTLPSRQTVQLGDFTVGVAHGNRLGGHAENIESGLLDIFPEADCVIYGHTHNAVCHRTPGEQGKLIINPGAFQMISRYGVPCSYAILEAGEQLKGSLHELPL